MTHKWQVGDTARTLGGHIVTIVALGEGGYADRAAFRFASGYLNVFNLNSFTYVPDREEVVRRVIEEALPGLIDCSESLAHRIIAAPDEEGTA